MRRSCAQSKNVIQTYLPLKWLAICIYCDHVSLFFRCIISDICSTVYYIAYIWSSIWFQSGRIFHNFAVFYLNDVFRIERITNKAFKNRVLVTSANRMISMQMSKNRLCERVCRVCTNTNVIEIRANWRCVSRISIALVLVHRRQTLVPRESYLYTRESYLAGIASHTISISEWKYSPTRYSYSLQYIAYDM